MRSPLKLLLTAAFLNSLAWIVVIPVWQYPDEQAHFAQVQFIAEVGNINYSLRTLDTSSEVALSEKILKTERDDLGNNSFTYHPEFKLPYTDSLYGVNEDKIVSLPSSARQEMVKKEATTNPPLYYLMGSLAYKLTSDGNLFTRVYAVRFISLIFFMLTIATTYQCAKLIFEKQKVLQLALSSMVATKPMLVFASTGVLPDSLTILLFSIFIYLGLKIIKDGFTITRTVAVAITIILGALTRQHFLITLAILPLLIFYVIFSDKSSRGKIVLAFTASMVILYIASYFFDSLSFIRRLDYPESSRKIAGNPLANLNYFEHLSWTIKHSVAEVWPWFWGVYKWLSLTLPPVVYQTVNRLISLAVLGVLIKIFLIARKGEYQKYMWLLFLLAVTAIYFLALTTFDFLYRRNNGFSFGIQGRYFFPVIIPTLSLFLIGITTLAQVFLRRYAKFIPLILIAMFMTFNIFTLIFLAHSYYETYSLEVFIKHASHYKPVILKGNIILVFLAVAIISQLLFLIKFFAFATSKNEK